MSRSIDIRRLLDRGRKAGLNTRELYSAMSGRSGEGNDLSPGQNDSNGYVSGYDAAGRPVFRPIEPQSRNSSSNETPRGENDSLRAAFVRASLLLRGGRSCGGVLLLDRHLLQALC